MANYCSVNGCNNNSRKAKMLSFFSIPKDPIRQSQWLMNIGRVDLLSTEPKIVSNRKVCGEHFRDEMFAGLGKSRLKRDAIPTVFKEAAIEQHDAQNQHVFSTSTGEQLQQFGELSTFGTPKDTNKDPLAHDDNIDDSNSDFFKHPSRVDTALCSSDLPPRSKRFYNRLLLLSKKLSRSKQTKDNFRKKLLLAENIAQHKEFRTLLTTLKRSIEISIDRQLENIPNRRFSFEEKILSLIPFFKLGNKGYALLSKLFGLPPGRSLKRLLEKLPLKPGINKGYFQSLKQKCSEMEPKDRKCLLLFDEISIRPNLKHNAKEDIVYGFANSGLNNSKRIADRVSVFMLKGIQKEWKQPLAFTFNCGPINSNALKTNIRVLINSCQKMGFHVVATICDERRNNQAAINELIAESKTDHYNGFTVNGKEIVPLYDIPHLIKRIRNHLVHKNLFYKNSQGKMVEASWDHILKLYKWDCSENLKVLKLKEQHVLPNKINKMKVLLATQVLSRQVGALMSKVAGSNVGGGIIPVEAKNTAEIILFFDELFDSVNGNTRKPCRDKPLKGGVTRTSGHIEFFENAAIKLQQMHFVCKKTKKKLSASSTIKNFITTLNNIRFLLRKLLNQRFLYVLPRAFNKDALENFSTLLRSHSVRKTSPSAVQFVNNYKSLIINNCLVKHSSASNCEQDGGVGLFSDISCLFVGNDTTEHLYALEDFFDEEININSHKRVDKYIVSYISGYVATKSISAIERCVECGKFLLQDGGKVPQNEFNFKKCRFFVPSIELYNYVKHIVCLVQNFLLKVAYKKQLLQNMLDFVQYNDPIKKEHNCVIHDLFHIVNYYIVESLINNYINSVNLILERKYFYKHINTLDSLKIGSIRLLKKHGGYKKM